MSETNRSTWDFLADTYWYVTPPDLPALQFSPGDNLLNWQIDQTVWHISNYKNGYFFGVSSAIIRDPDDTNNKPRQVKLVGTVTAGGQVQITFIGDRLVNDTVITGFGHITKVDDQWTFQMQMVAATGSNYLFHWANMMQTKEGDPSWDNLPGVDYSVPEMLTGASYPHFSGYGQ
ncbi:hypothetical protein [Methylogaea oryzae]|uniref:Uncharacterized protein n=1 Tax=Methylogaea oryzae TaxID=1295382 RepID=A0A8D4VPV0_9GAMM|nr:hypothetical protein [Methylogaea oryzae]BBL71042.1 hypothetical protein MoryE10_16480 [Methylogaea oryzae]